jgi:hypothetical protein
MPEFFSTYGKSIVAFAFAVVTAVQAAVFDGHISQVEWVQISIAAVTAFVVWLAPRLPHAGGIKTAAAVGLAVLNVLVTVILGGLSQADITEMVLAALTVLGVGYAPAQSTVSLKG